MRVMYSVPIMVSVATLLLGSLTAQAQEDSPRHRMVLAAQDKVAQDRRTLTENKLNLKILCQNPGAACDTATARVEADKNQLLNDEDKLETARHETDYRQHKQGDSNSDNTN